jgi:hypothetical protein
LPEVEVLGSLQPFRDRWLKDLREELLPLRGKKIDPRFIESVAVQ